MALTVDVSLEAVDVPHDHVVSATVVLTIRSPQGALLREALTQAWAAGEGLDGVRAAEAREDHRPRLSDLCESGAIEQEADTVLLVHREDYYHRHEGDYRPTNAAEVIVAKQRSGPPGVAVLRFDPLTISFTDPA